MATVVQRPDPMAGLNTALMGYFRQMQMQKQRQDQQQQQQIENQRAQQQMGISQGYLDVGRGQLDVSRQNAISNQFANSRKAALEGIDRRDKQEVDDQKAAEAYTAMKLKFLTDYEPGSQARVVGAFMIKNAPISRRLADAEGFDDQAFINAARLLTANMQREQDEANRQQWEDKYNRSKELNDRAGMMEALPHLGQPDAVIPENAFPTPGQQAQRKAHMGLRTERRKGWEKQAAHNSNKVKDAQLILRQDPVDASVGEDNPNYKKITNTIDSTLDWASEYYVTLEVYNTYQSVKASAALREALYRSGPQSRFVDIPEDFNPDAVNFEDYPNWRKDYNKSPVGFLKKAIKIWEEKSGSKAAAAPSKATATAGQDEQSFRKWYAQKAQQLGLDPNPDDPRHHYDYRAAYQSGMEGPTEPGGHWDSRFKDAQHPNRFVGGMDTITGQPAAQAAAPSKATAAPPPVNAAWASLTPQQQKAKDAEFYAKLKRIPKARQKAWFEAHKHEIGR